MTLPEFISLLKTGGPYTALAVMVWVARFLYLEREKDKEKHDAEKAALNERIITIVENQNSSLERAIENQHTLIEAVRSATGSRRRDS